jgi:hypothetical protein
MDAGPVQEYKGTGDNNISPVSALAVDPRGRTLYRGSLDGTIAAWNLQSGTRVANCNLGITKYICLVGLACVQQHFSYLDP